MTFSHKFDPSEVRFGRPFEVKASSSGRIEGLASPFGGDPDAYGDIVAPGAFAKSLALHEAERTAPAMLWSHDPSRLVGRWTRLVERQDGLHVEGSLNLKTTEGAQAFEHVRAGDLDGLSIGFDIPKGGAEFVEGRRMLREIALMEVSLVAMPAARRARVTAVKSIAGPDELRDILRNSGLPHRAAEKIAAGGWAVLNGRSPDELEAEFRETEIADLAAQLRKTASAFERK